MKEMETKAIAPAVWDSLHEELQTAAVQLWKDAQEVAFRKHLERGEILTRFAKTMDLPVSLTVSKYAERYGAAESSLRFSVDVYEKFPTLESIYALPEGESITVRKLRDGYIYKKQEKEAKERCECPTCGNKHML